MTPRLVVLTIFALLETAAHPEWLLRHVEVERGRETREEREKEQTYLG